MATTTPPSKFWQELASAHVDQLSSHGLGEIKRQQALRYFTWQWRWGQIHRSEQFRFLLQNTSKLDLLLSALAPQPFGDALWQGLAWTRRDRWLYAFATRLIWDYARSHGAAVVLALGEPSLGNPPPVQSRGRLISQDLANSALEVAAVRKGLQGTAPTSILEVGGGYGRTAYSLLGAFPQARYTIIDIEPAISLSKWYLGTLYPQRDIRFLLPHEATAEKVGRVDLALSISSLQEMTTDQVQHYLELFDDVVEGHVFLKQWARWANPVDGIVLDFDLYPFPDRWSSVLKEPSPVQTAFVQAMWHVQRKAASCD